MLSATTTRLLTPSVADGVPARVLKVTLSEACSAPVIWVRPLTLSALEPVTSEVTATPSRRAASTVLSVGSPVMPTRNRSASEFGVPTITRPLVASPEVVICSIESASGVVVPMPIGPNCPPVITMRGWPLVEKVILLSPAAANEMPSGSVPTVAKLIEPLTAVMARLPAIWPGGGSATPAVMVMSPGLSRRGVVTEVPAMTVVKAPAARVVPPIGMPSMLPPVSTALSDCSTPSAVMMARTRLLVTSCRSVALVTPRKLPTGVAPSTGAGVSPGVTPVAGRLLPSRLQPVADTNAAGETCARRPAPLAMITRS